MRNFSCGLFLLLAAGILFSCGSKNQEKKFFDVPGYFEKEIEYIKITYSAVSKTSSYNGETQMKEFKVTEINWKKEFGIFMECDINRPIYYANLSKIPTAALDTNAHSIKYKSKSTKTNIDEIEIGFTELSTGDEAHFISVRIRKSNLINATSIKAIYAKDHYYRIEGDQHVKYLGEHNSFKVEGVFLK